MSGVTNFAASWMVGEDADEEKVICMLRRKSHIPEVGTL